MSCAACQARVEKAVSKVDGVSACSVSLLTNSMGVEGDALPEDIIKAVEKAGYGARLKKAKDASATDDISPDGADDEEIWDDETQKLKKRLVTSVVFLFALMYITMGANMAGLPLPPFLSHNHLGLALTQAVLAAIVMIINRKFFTGGFSSLIKGAPNMDTLVALGSSVSFVWSIIVFYRMTLMIRDGAVNADLMELYHNGLYFESAAMIVALITVGKMLESMSKGRTTNALKSLMRLKPKTAVIIRDGEEVSVPVGEVLTDDIFVVRAGDSIPVDGVVIEGVSAVNESALTGESVPVDKAAGDSVSAATINSSGYLKCRATRVGEDTTLSQIIRMVSDAAATKAPIARIADRVSGVFVPAVILISIAVTVLWIALGAGFGDALERGICVLVISCPCALGLATPVAIMVGNGVGAKRGILFKTSEALENAGKVSVVALDKTGTITTGEPVVTDIIPLKGFDEKGLLMLAASLEAKSAHPLSKAVVNRAKEEGMTETDEARDFAEFPGKGLSAVIGGSEIFGGSFSFINEKVSTGDEENIVSELADEGKTPLLFAKDGKLIGIIAVADVVRNDAKEAIALLKKKDIRVVMLTGDNVRTAKAIGSEAGVDEVIAGVLPDGKEAAIQTLKDGGRVRVAMVGDGINDAVALTCADTGIAIGAGTDVAIDSADVVLMNPYLMDIPTAIDLSRATLRNIHQNLFWAFFYNVICIPLAAGAFGFKMSPMIGAAAMSLSSFSVCMNALRLNLFDPGYRHERTDTDITIKRRNEMEQTVKIEGMMCAHCEAAVKKALEELPFVESADVSHEKGNAVLRLGGDMDEAAVKKAVEDKDYTYLGTE